MMTIGIPAPEPPKVRLTKRQKYLRGKSLYQTFMEIWFGSGSFPPFRTRSKKTQREYISLALMP